MIFTNNFSCAVFQKQRKNKEKGREGKRKERERKEKGKRKEREETEREEGER